MLMDTPFTPNLTAEVRDVGWNLPGRVAVLPSVQVPLLCFNTDGRQVLSQVCALVFAFTAL